MQPFIQIRNAIEMTILLGCIIQSTGGCGGDTGGIDETERVSELIGGRVATHPSLNHTGVLLFDNGVELELLCTATLIAPRTVITAKHCAQTPKRGYEVFFSTGPNGYSPEEIIPIAAVQMAPLDEGGFIGLGYDAAVIHLDREPVNATPIAVKPSDELAVGDRMVSIGYGRFSAGGAGDGQRRIGRVTIAATEGLALEALYGDFETFVEWGEAKEVTEKDYLTLLGEEVLAEYRAIYESKVLLDSHEAAVGVADGDSQICFGDSGGPLLRYNGEWETLGVVSGSFVNTNQLDAGLGIHAMAGNGNTPRSICDFGAVYTTFGPELMAFIDTSLAWRDPCDEIETHFACEQNLAVNCETDIRNGTRELTSRDCTKTGQTCVILDNAAACAVVPDT